MSIFRSEEHVRNWTTANDQDVGAIVPLAQVWKLAKAWYSDPRVAPGGRVLVMSHRP